MQLGCLRQNLVNPQPILFYVTWSAVRPQRMGQEAPNIFGCRALKEQVPAIFILSTKSTCTVALPFKLSQIVFSKNDVLNDKPHENLNFQRNLSFPNHLETRPIIIST
jgi:hypothetical protein